MTASVLVVDDLAPNVKLLEAKLRAEYFEVMSALGGQEAIDIARDRSPDIILLDVMMPGLDGFEACRILKEDPLTCHIPVVMVTALDQQADRVAGLNAGADDFLTKPVQDLALFARVRSLTRLKQLTDELRHRHAKGAELGVIRAKAETPAVPAVPDEILVIADEVPDELQLSDPDLAAEVVFVHEADARTALERVRQDPPSMVMVDLGLESYDALRMCSAIRSFESSRLLPVLALSRQSDMRRLVRALDIGVTDYLLRPIDPQEMNARVRTQLRRKRYVEELRQSLTESFELAVTDPLTGLYNRRYLGNRLPELLTHAADASEALSLLIIDVDHFKRVNDTHGHDVGDEVLKEVASRLLRSTRGIDLACRFGGEEFVFVLPDTSGNDAEIIAERLRAAVAESPITTPSGVTVEVTVSIGLAAQEAGGEYVTPQVLLKHADAALYAAKSQGRNQVIKTAA